MTTYELRKILADNLTYVMERDGLTGADIQSITKHDTTLDIVVSQAAVSYYRNQIRSARLDYIQALADALNTPRWAMLIEGGAKLAEDGGLAALVADYARADKTGRETINAVAAGQAASADLERQQQGD